jgi:hypothetical protein
MKNTVLQLVLSVLAAMILTAEAVGEASEKVDTLVTIEEQAAMLESNPAFMAVDSDIQGAWLCIANLASKYHGITEEDLLSLPGIQSKEEKNQGHSLHVVTQDSDGTKTEFWFNRSYSYLTGVRRFFADRSTVNVSLTKYVRPERVGVARGFFVQTENGKVSEFSFDSQLTRPEMALICSGKAGGADAQARVLLWSENGKLLADHVAPLSNDPMKREEEKSDAIVAARIGAGLASSTEILQSSPPYKSLDSRTTSKAFYLKDGMENTVRWSEKLVHARPEELVEKLQGTVLEKSEKQSEVEYIIKGEGTVLWTVVYDKASNHLKRATHNDGGLALYFGYESEAQLLAGIATVREIGKEDCYWLLSFYPGKFTPRMAIAAVRTPAIAPDAAGARNSSTPPNDLQGMGEVFIWSPAGVQIVRNEVASATPLEEVFADIGVAMSDTERSEIGWKGSEAEQKIWVQR